MSSTGLGRPFWYLWAAFTTSNLADGFSLVAFPLLAIQLTDDARLIALVSAARFLPFIVIGLPAGVIIDRFDRRWLAAGAQFARALMLAAVAAAVLAEVASIGVLMGGAFLMGCSEVLTDGGLPAMVRDLVEPNQLEVANSRLSAVMTVANVFVGPPLGALLFAVDPTVPFIVAAGLAVVTVGALAILPGRYRPPVADDAGDGIGRRITRGLRYVWGHPVLRPLALTVAAFAFVGEAGNAVFVILMTERFGLSEVEFGVMVAIDGVASVAMSFLVAGLVARTSHTTSMRLAVVTFSVAAFLFGTSTVIAGAIIGSLFAGISDPSWNVVSTTIRQRLVPDEIFGRMMTAYLFVAWSIQPLGAVVGGIIAEQWGPQWVYIMSGTVVGSLLVFGRPLFRAIDRSMAELGSASETTTTDAGATGS